MKTDRVVVVTGATGGMGALVVDRFLANGDIVVATDTQAASLAALRGRHESDARLHTVAADVSSEADCGAVADLAQAEAGRVDVLVNVAGWFPTRAFEDLTADEFRRVVDVNLTGVFLMMKAVYPLMKGRGWGRIVTVGSASTFEGVPDQVHYVAAKAGLFGLSRSIARAIGKDGITVNVVTPGLTVTPVVRRNLPAEMLERQVDLRCIRREEKAEDLIGAIFFLASPDADFISGQTVNVDGGKHLL